MSKTWRTSILLLPLLWAQCGAAEWHSDTQAIMGTEVSLTLWHEQAQVAERAIAEVMAEMRRIDGTLSPYKPGSELSRVNREAANAPQPISAELELLVGKANWVSEISGGAFDITFASVGYYYDYRHQQQPSAEQRQKLLAAINYRWLKLDKTHHTLAFAHPDVRIDLGGIAKGYAVDRAAEILRRLGVEHASVSAGGDSRIIGDRRGRPWIVGIKNPRAHGDADQTLIRMPLENVALSTSGDYERYFIDAKGERIHHILNPRTGKSATGVESVTIVGDRGLDTDPLSTTVFVLGVEEGLALVNRLPGIDGVIIDSEGRVHYSAGLMAPTVN